MNKKVLAQRQSKGTWSGSVEVESMKSAGFEKEGTMRASSEKTGGYPRVKNDTVSESQASVG